MFEDVWTANFIYFILYSFRNIMDGHDVSSFQSSFPQNLKTLYHFMHNIVDKNRPFPRTYKIFDLKEHFHKSSSYLYTYLSWTMFANAKKN